MAFAAQTDGYSSVLREAVETIRSRDHVNVLTPDGLREALTEPALYRQYKTMLSEGMSAESAAALDVFSDNFQMTVFRESSLSGIQPVSVLTMPMLRKAWQEMLADKAFQADVKKRKFNFVPTSGEKLEAFYKKVITSTPPEVVAILKEMFP